MINKIKQLTMTATMAAVFCSSACSQGKGFIVKGHLEGMAGNQLFLLSSNDNDDKKGPKKFTVDNNGDFELKDTVSSAIMAEYSLMDPSGITLFKGGGMMGTSAIFYAQNGDVIVVSGSKQDFTSSQFSGNKSNAENMELQLQLKDVNAQEKIIWDQVGVLMKQHSPANRPKIDSLQNLADPFEASARQIKIDFIRKHPDALVSAKAMSQISKSMSVEDAKALFSTLNKEVQESASGKTVQEMIGLDVAEKNTDAGKPAPDFIKQTREGKNFKLSDYKGKYVLLDFWGSWCGACRASHPHLKQIYEKYNKDGLVIIGIAYERTQDKTAWIKAIKQDGLPWTQILNDEGTLNVVDLYGVQAFPTKVLIDKEGNVVMRLVGTNVAGSAHGPDDNSTAAAPNASANANAAQGGSASNAGAATSSSAGASSSASSAAASNPPTANQAADEDLSSLDRKLKVIFNK